MAFASAMLRKMLWGLESANISRRQLLDGIIDPSRLGDDFWLPDADYYEIVARALEISQNPGLGLVVGQREGNFALGALGLHVSISSSFEQALNAIVRLQLTLSDRHDLSLHRNGPALTLQFGPIDPPPPVRWFVTEVMLASMQVLFTQFAGLDAEPIAVLLDYPAPPHAAMYHEVFPCDVRFDQPHSALMVPRALAEREQLLSQPGLAAELGKLAEVRLEEQNMPGISGQVRSLLRQQWKTGSPNMRDLAKQLGLSERTLRRRLAAEGVHFRTILAEGRCELAREMLQTGMGIKQVAYELGYRSSSAFHKAFRRWAGASPSAYVARERRAAA